MASVAGQQLLQVLVEAPLAPLPPQLGLLHKVLLLAATWLQLAAQLQAQPAQRHGPAAAAGGAHLA
jgi:hypothetical protein